MSVGENIRKLRKAAGLTQKELGKRSGINEAQIRRYELGGENSTPKIETVQKIAEALGVDPYSLYSFEMATATLEKEMNETDKKENVLLEKYRRLNTIGKDKAIEQVNLLTKIPDYTKKDPDQ